MVHLLLTVVVRSAWCWSLNLSRWVNTWPQAARLLMGPACRSPDPRVATDCAMAVSCSCVVHLVVQVVDGLCSSGLIDSVVTNRLFIGLVSLLTSCRLKLDVLCLVLCVILNRW